MQRLLEESRQRGVSNTHKPVDDRDISDTFQKQKLLLEEQLKGARLVIEVMSEQLESSRDTVNSLEQEKLALEEQLAGTEAAMDALAAQMSESQGNSMMELSSSDELATKADEDRSDTTTESVSVPNHGFDGGDFFISKRGDHSGLGVLLDENVHWDKKTVYSNSSILI